MSNIGEIYNRVLKKITNLHPEIIYLAIGSSLGRYEIVEDKHDQQHPLFMNKYENSKKVTILIDPALEKSLVITKKIPFIKTYQKEMYRFYEHCEEGKHHLHAINNYFYFDKNEHNRNSIKQPESDYDFLIRLIEYTLQNNIKLIVQDYSGNDIIPYYIDLLDIFPKKEMCEKVIFDITQKDGGCIIDFSNYPIYYDSQDNFIQPGFKPLTNLKEINKSMYKSLIYTRLNYITSNLSRQIRVLKGELEPHQYNEKTFDMAFKLMSITYEGIVYSKKPKIEHIQDAIMYILLDICQSLELSPSYVSEIQENGFKQDHIYKTLSPIKVLITEIPE